MSFKLIVGLGNPGERYAKNRHNIGFLVVDQIAKTEGLVWKREKKWDAMAAVGNGFLLLKPITFMNESGRAVGACMRWLKVKPEEVLVVVDDVALKVGVLRLREKGGAGGHNGLYSVENHMGGEGYPRLRCGVGSVPSGWAMEDYVLSGFFDEEKKVVEEMINKAVSIFRYCQKERISVAMSFFNQKNKNEEKIKETK